MNDILNSTAFQEFLQKRYKEIIENDKECIEMNNVILGLEQKILPLLSDEALKVFLEMEDVYAKLLSHVGTLLYSRSVSDLK